MEYKTVNLKPGEPLSLDLLDEHGKNGWCLRHIRWNGGNSTYSCEFERASAKARMPVKHYMTLTQNPPSDEEKTQKSQQGYRFADYDRNKRYGGWAGYYYRPL